MLSHALDSLGRFFVGGTPLEIGLFVVAVVSLAVAYRLRQLRQQVARRALLFQSSDDATPVPTARQWLARENAMNDLPPLRDPAPFEPALFQPSPAPAAPPKPAENRPPETSAPEAGFAEPAAAAENRSFESRPHDARTPESRPVDDAIVFPTGHDFADYSHADLPPLRATELPETGAIATILSDGLDELASRGDSFADAVRAHPIRYVTGALATGFVAGLAFPIIYGQQRVARLLERMIASNEELKRVRLEERRELPRPETDRREAERLRQVG